jgi:ubiquinone/menaquinone biosynthesis C-methylase UbiE
MLARARRRAAALSLGADLRCGDAQALPFEAAAFDAVILTLILSVVPDPRRCLGEARRVLRPGGRAVVFDKFLAPERARPSPARRLLNVLTRLFGTDINRRFDAIARGLDFEIVRDAPAGFSGAYRIILLRRS